MPVEEGQEEAGTWSLIEKLAGAQAETKKAHDSGAETKKQTKKQHDSRHRSGDDGPRFRITGGSHGRYAIR